jgi:hypothetical protein
MGDRWIWVRRPHRWSRFTAMHKLGGMTDGEIDEFFRQAAKMKPGMYEEWCWI